MKLPSSLADVIARHLQHAWRGRGALACLLWPWSRLFGGLGAARRALYRRGWLHTARLPVPVIVVGNIYVGGTGKTPLTIWLVQALRAAGYRPGVISRGYGGSAAAPRLVGAAAGVDEVGDEPLLIAERSGCPVMVGRNRAAAAHALLAACPEVNLIVADDGLQHYALARDIEIMLFDERGVGNGWLLPAGPLREAASRRRDFTVINTSQAVAPPAFRMELIGVIAEQLIDRSQRLPLTPLLHLPAAEGGRQASRVLAAAGIGNPGRFFAMLRAAGVLFDAMPLPDHYPYVDDPFAADTADIILITEKDAVKCSRHASLKHDPRLWVVPVTARIDGALAEHILEKLRGHPTA